MAELPIYHDSYRPSSNWAKRLEAARQAHPAAAVLAAQPRWLPKWIAGLEAYAVPPFDTASDATAPAADATAPAALERATRWLLARATAKPGDQRDALTMDDLETACRELVGEQGDTVQVWRTAAGRPQVETHQPAAPAALPVLLEMTLDWFTTDAFAELHPVEQAGLFHLRLLDLQPFAARTNTLVRLLSSFYLLRAGFPPIIPVAEEQSAYRDVVGYAFQMITQPSVELFARWLLAAYSLIETEQEERR
ncbi:Fic family protein [Chloracidobacterium aggregatum]|uniref:Fic family protein n=1 Tax=Chloracidobacterium aggregatum TaxID=2851959 RepID=UPI001B8ACD30|nr:Fic family protein [Chloracidobacterium aggregatum]QUV85623.1 Fic family protein [Chloracidobacterium sp. 2]QUV87972.1 Fic family protein [Chloracidobacterium sp. S]QUV90892.1 Fic family protein [Chloracidobacterium sp. A]